ncbi:YncE family protein, partial [Francisella philomiragia]
MRKITTLIILVVISNLAFAQQTSISISSNGQYAISVDGAGNAYLWNLREHSSENIAGKYNYKSAYFIPNSDYYLLQDKNDTKIIVNNISGKEVFSFDPKLEANSHAISSDLKYYVTSNYEFDTYMFLAQEDKKRHLIVNWCMGDHGGKQYQGNNPSDCAYGNMQFNFTKDNKRLLATSSGYLYDFDLTNNHWKSIIVGGPNAMNAIDPNGEFVYTADSHTGIKYNLETGKVSNSAFYGTANIPDVTYLKNNEKKVLMDSISNFKFIDKDKIIVTFKGLSQPYLWAF